MKKQFNTQSAIEMAYFRFALIAPVIQGIFPDPTKTAYYRRVTENELMLPNGKTMRYNPKILEKWEEYYRKNGMDGLMPRQRSDAGTPRVLSEQAISEIYRLKEKFPRINATLIYNKLIEDGFINHSEVSLSSVQRFIKHNDLRSATNPNQKDRKRPLRKLIPEVCTRPIPAIRPTYVKTESSGVLISFILWTTIHALL